MYDIRLHRLNVMSHMTIVGLIHNRCLTIKDGVFDDSAAVTLMSNDVEQIMFSADLSHELWSQTFELCIGMYLLATELGWVCIVPLLIVVCTLLQIHNPPSLNFGLSSELSDFVLVTSQGCKFVTAHIADRQKAVSMATQTRISITKAILDSIKNIKMMGLIDKMEAKIQAARDHEITMYTNLNQLFVAFYASGKLPSPSMPCFLLSPES
jgi:ATP-binding cassette subfamily C (CFTR/MRP) protein 1